MQWALNFVHTLTISICCSKSWWLALEHLAQPSITPHATGRRISVRRYILGFPSAHASHLRLLHACPPAAKATQYNGHLPCWAQPSLLHPLTLATSGANLQAGLVRRFTPPPVHHSHPSPCSDAGQKDAIHQPTHTAICSTPLVLSTLQTHICMSTQTYIQ